MGSEIQDTRCRIQRTDDIGQRTEYNFGWRIADCEFGKHRAEGRESNRNSGIVE